MKNKKGRSILPDILLVAAVVVVGIVVTVLVLRKGQSRSTDTFSTDMLNSERKIEFLQEYLACPSPVEDAEYHIVYRDGEEPAWKIAAALKVSRDDVPLWTDGFEEVSQLDEALWDSVPDEPLEAEAWDATSPPVYYQRAGGDSWLMVHADEGIIYKYTASD